MRDQWKLLIQNDPRPEFWPILGGPKIGYLRPIFSTSPKQTCNKHVKQCWCEISANVVRNWSKTAITLGEIRSIQCTKSPLYVRSGSHIKQMPLEYSSYMYIKQMPLDHLLYIKETPWNTSNRAWNRAEFTQGGNFGAPKLCIWVENQHFDLVWGPNWPQNWGLWGIFLHT